ncbi:hypothetical protein [Streptomyces venezuelae]|uniref:hypothetical protein n=1 Tax=Streptomyces venezuelae TaxID=54571 RepID=UPI0036536D1B
MSDLEKAARDAIAAADSADMARQITAILTAQQLLNAQPQAQHQGCQHTPQDRFNAKKWLTIGGLACIGGCVACALAVAFAMAMIAVAIGGCCATSCLLVLRSMWNSHRKGR